MQKLLFFMLSEDLIRHRVVAWLVPAQLFFINIAKFRRRSAYNAITGVSRICEREGGPMHGFPLPPSTPSCPYPSFLSPPLYFIAPPFTPCPPSLSPLNGGPGITPGKIFNLQMHVGEF
jgi:hypothetical protein